MSIELIIQTLFLFIFCLVLAILEVQIEAGSGWASNLPTWRAPYPKWYSKVYRKIMSERDLTGYHLSVFSLVLLVLHYPYFAGQSWNLSSELTTLSFFFVVSIVWDFLWFVVNPHYSFKTFWSENVWWHKKWFWHFPSDYWLAVVISALLYTGFSLDWVLLKEWLQMMSLMLFLTIITVISAIKIGIFNEKKN